MAWVAKDYIGEWIFNCKPGSTAGVKERGK